MTTASRAMGGTVRMIASIEDPAVIEKILTHIGRRDAASPDAPRAPPASSGDQPPHHLSNGPGSVI